MPVISRAVLKTLWPRAPQRTIDAIVATAPAVFRQYGMTSDLCVAHFMAQISHECGGGTIVRENMNYTAARLMQIFGVGVHSAKVTEDEAQQLAHHPEQIAERVYGLGNPGKAKELGNLVRGDAYRCRGNGMLQLTGGASHKHIGELTGFDLYEHPEQLEDPAVSLKVAAAEFVALKCLPAAEQDNVGLVTRRVNGGNNGLGERTAWLRKWKAALVADDSDEDIVAEAIDADAAPRASEKPSVLTTINNSKIAKVATGIGVGTAGDVLSTISDNASTAASIKTSADDIGITDHLAHLAVNPRFWIGLLILAGVCGIIYWRWRDHAGDGQ